MTEPRRPILGFVGAGVVGSALSAALSAAGYQVACIHSRNAVRLGTLVASLPGTRAAQTRQDVADACDIVFLTVSDDALRDVVASIHWGAGTAAVTTHGAAALDVLEGARRSGAAVGIFHPLKSFASAAQGRQFAPGTTVRIDASTDDLRFVLTRMAEDLGGRALAFSGDPSLYHAGAVLASNALVTIVDIAAELWGHLGIGKEEAVRALLPLVRGTVDNLDRLGTPRALTGPVARGDVGTLARHLEVLARVAPAAAPVYKELARRTIPVALAKGTIDADAAARLSRVLEGPEEQEPSCE